MPFNRRLLLLGLPAAGLLAQAHAAEDAVMATIRTLEADLKTRFGVQITDRETGRSWAYRADERFPMTSTFKALAAAAILQEVDRGALTLDQRIEIKKEDLVTYSPVVEKAVGQGMTIGEICEAAVTLSDNAAGNHQLRLLGGPEGFTRFLRSLGDNISRLDRWETTLNEATPGDPRDTTTPAMLAANLEKVTFGDALSPASRRRMQLWLLANKTGDTKVRAGVPPGWQVGDKTGAGGFGSNNDTGFILASRRRPIFYAMMMTQTEAPVAQKNEGMAIIARALIKALEG